MNKRPLTLDIYDYSGNRIVNLYDSSNEMSGEAVDIKKTEERNGWKELSFTLPCTCFGENGEEENYRLQYLIADYKIRFDDGKEPDWFIISEPKVTHDNFSKTVNVVAGHVAQLLKTKKLSLEFSIDEGNNVGTAEELLACVLEGTDWKVGEVASFNETFDPTAIKKRTLTAGAQTGAFRLIEMICELFDAKPVYHSEQTYTEDGETKVRQAVDIIPMNPFSKDKFNDVSIPKEVANGDKKILELHYAKNLTNITRTLNTNNIVTKLYAYGSYGDLNGECSLMTCKHDEYIYKLTAQIDAGTEVYFFDSFGAKYYCTIRSTHASGATLVWSQLDITSRGYIWSPSKANTHRVYKVPKKTTQINLEDVSTLEIRNVENLFPYILNFSYYDEIGLLTQGMLNKIGAFQRRTPALYQASRQAYSDFADRLNDLSKIGRPNTGFLRFVSSGYTVNNDKTTTVTIKTSQYEHGVMYRSDYMEIRKKQFIWHVAKSLKANGDPVTGAPSYVLIAHDNGDNPITWEKAYIKEIYAKDKNGTERRVEDSEGNPGDFVPATEDESSYPSKLVLWAPMSKDNRKRSLPAYKSTDQFFLFCTISNGGQIAGVEASEEAVLNHKVQTSNGDIFEDHPIYFMNGTSGMDTVPDVSALAVEGRYGWYYRYFPLQRRFGNLYYCGPKDTQWKYVHCSDTEPETGSYYYDTVYRVLYARSGGKWVKLDSLSDKIITRCFSEVIYYCHMYDELYKGVYDYYYYLVDGNETGTYISSGLPIGKYLLADEYDSYWGFSTTTVIPRNTTLKLDTQNKYLYQNNDVGNITTVARIPKDLTINLKPNEISKENFSEGFIDPETGIEGAPDATLTGPNYYRSSYIKVYPGEKYILEMPIAQLKNSWYRGYVIFYDSNRNFISSNRIASASPHTGGEFTVPIATALDADPYVPDAEYIRIMWAIADFDSNDNVFSLCVKNYNKKVYSNDNSHTLYTILDITGTGDNLLGLNNLMARFINTANTAYLEYRQAYEDAQAALAVPENEMNEALGLILREGYWHDDSYTDDDQEKLYNDAMDNLEEIGKPEATYNITFVDQYGSNENMGYSIDGSTDLIPYHDIEISNAVHLVDPEIDVNCWAYLDKVTICYDKPWETSIEINTRLSLIGQHDFTDVLSAIADVAKTSKARQAVYDASARMNGLNPSGGNVNVTDGDPYTGLRVNVPTFDGVAIEGANYQGVNPEGLNYGGVKIDATSFGGVTLDGQNPIEPAVIHGANVSGLILSRSNFAGAVSKGMTVEDTFAKYVRDEMDKMMQDGNVQFKNTTSNWYTDEETGHLIFEEQYPNGVKTGKAFALGGSGIYRAIKFNPITQRYDWINVMNGNGIVADNITSGTLRSELIEAGTIRTNHLTADVGQMLDISSNKGLDLFATVDGTKPSGALKTTDAIIEIHAAMPPTTNEAQINILSGGSINLEAGASGQDNGSINIKANRAINIESGGTLDLKSNGNMKVESNANLDILSQGTLTLQSGAKEDVDGQIDIKSTGKLNLLSNGTMTLAAGITSSDTSNIYLRTGEEGSYTYTAFTPTFTEGAPDNFAYTNSGNAYVPGYTPTAYLVRKLANGTYQIITGGRININSTNGIDIMSGGTIRLRSGAKQGVAGKIEIQSTGEIDVAAGGTLTLRSNSSTASGGLVQIQSTGTVEVQADALVDIKAGSTVKIGAGQTGNRDAKVEIGSTGDVEIKGNGAVKITSVPDVGTSVSSYRYSWKAGKTSASSSVVVVPSGSVTASTKAAAYNNAVTQIKNAADDWYSTNKTEARRGYANYAASTSIASLELMMIDNAGNEFTGGRVYIGAENGIDVQSGGSIRIGSGSSELVNGNIEIMSNGTLRIGANAKLRIDAGTTDPALGDPIPGEMIISSTGLINMEAGSEMNIGVGTPGNKDAKLNICSTGELNILANGELRLASGINQNDGTSYYYEKGDGTYASFTPTYSSGSPTNFTYDDDGYAVRTADKTQHICTRTGTSPNYVYSYVKGGQITIESTNGIDIKSAKGLRIGAGASGSIDGSIEIGSTGSIDITANGELNLNGGIFTVSSRKFAIDASGNVEMEGKVTATSGSIGTWTIGSNYIGDADSLAACTIGMRKATTDTQLVFFAGADGTAFSTATFFVRRNGALYASNADIEGKVTATSGSIGGWTIGTGSTKGNYIGNAATRDESTVGLAVVSENSSIALWAGGARSAEGGPPFSVTKGGKLTATNAVIQGEITAKTGKIGNWNITSTTLNYHKEDESTHIWSNYVGMGGSTYAFWAGAAGTAETPTASAADAPFIVKADGSMTASNADITGKITATSGNIAGWTISSDYISSWDGTSAEGNLANRRGMSASTYSFFAGTPRNSANNGWVYANSAFYVKSDGSLKATSADITGKITATSGTIGGWTIGTGSTVGNYIGNADTRDTSTIGLAVVTSDSAIALWLGDARTATGGPPFYVTKAGKLKATNAEIEGVINAKSGGTIAGWNIGQRNIWRYDEDETTHIRTNYIGMGIEDYTFWAGANGTTASSTPGRDKSPFYVTKQGALHATDAYISGNVEITSGSISIKNGSTVYFSVSDTGELMARSGRIGRWKLSNTTLTAYTENATTLIRTNGIGMGGTTYAFWAGADATAASTDPSASAAKFWVKTDGSIKATSGTIGGWSLTDSRIASGSTTTYVAMSSDADSTFAFWAGKATTSVSSPAPFAVQRDGTVYLTKLKVYNEKTSKIETIDLSSSNDDNRLRGATVLGWNINSSTGDVTISTTYGQINFNRAASATVSGAWSGETFTATVSNGEYVQTTIAIGNGIPGGTATAIAMTFDSNHIGYGNVSATQSDAQGVRYPILFSVDATSVYNDGKKHPTLTGTWSNNGSLAIKANGNSSTLASVLLGETHTITNTSSVQKISVNITDSGTWGGGGSGAVKTFEVDLSDVWKQGWNDAVNSGRQVTYYNLGDTSHASQELFYKSGSSYISIGTGWTKPTTVNLVLVPQEKT